MENARGGWGSSRRDSQPHRRGCWRDPQGPKACTSPPTREPAPEGPNLIVGSGGSDEIRWRVERAPLLPLSPSPPALEPWVKRSASLPTVRPGLSVRECGTAGSASGQTACPIRPTLCQSQSRQGHRSPLRLGALLHPSYRSG